MENHQPAENQQLNFYNNPEEEEEKKILPGFRFNPYEAELFDHYLLKLVRSENTPEGLRIPAVDLYHEAPQELTAKYEEHCEEQWYFFTKRNRKYSGGNRPNRVAGNGHWKQTNTIKRIFSHETKSVELGRKITLDYYDKSSNPAGEHTTWKMNEYRVNEKLPDIPMNYSRAGSTTELSEWCLCRIYISSRNGNKTDNVGATSEEENEQVTSNAEVTLQATEIEFAPGTNFLQQNTEHTIGAAAQEYGEQVVAEADAHFVIPQNTAPLSNDQQHIIAPQEYYGQNPGGLDTNSFQLSTTPFINDAFSNSNSFYFQNINDGPIDWMSFNNDFGLIGHEEIYPLADQLHDNGFVQPITSVPATGLPMLPYSYFNQSSSSIPGDVTWGPGDGSLASLVFGNGQSNSDGGFKNGGFNQFGN